MKQPKGQARKSITVGELLEMIKVIEREKTYPGGSMSSGRYAIHLLLDVARARRKPLDAIVEEIIINEGCLLIYATGKSEENE